MTPAAEAASARPYGGVVDSRTVQSLSSGPWSTSP